MLRRESGGWLWDRGGGGRPIRRCMDCLTEDMRTAGVTEEDAQDRVRWRRTIRTCDPRDGK